MISLKNSDDENLWKVLCSLVISCVQGKRSIVVPCFCYLDILVLLSQMMDTGNVTFGGAATKLNCLA